jgi:hypothetical protein
VSDGGGGGQDLIAAVVNINDFGLLHDDNEDGMRSAAHLIHLRLSSRTDCSALLHESIDLSRRPHHPLRQPRHVHALLLVLANQQIGVLIFEQVRDLERARNEERRRARRRDLLVVDLEVGGTNKESHPGANVSLDVSEDLFNGSGNDPSGLHTCVLAVEPFHGEGLPCSGLAI